MQPSPFQNVPAWLADVSIQSTLILGLTWLLLKILVQNSAAHRCLIAGAAIMSIPGVMLVSTLFPNWRLIQPVPAPSMVASATWQIRATSASEPSRPSPLPNRSPVTVHRWTASQWLTGTWLLGIGGISAGLLLAAVRLRRIEAMATLPNETPLLNTLAALTTEAGLNPASVRLLLTRQSRVPMTWGLISPRIILPQESSHWPQDRLELVLRHELAHITRRDTLWTLLVHLSGMLLWFHPVVWAMLRTFAAEREAACDDLALSRVGQDPVRFAQNLLDAISACSGETRPFLPLALCMAAGDKATVKARLAAVLDTTRSRSVCTARHGLATLSIASTLIVLAAGLSACRPAPKGPTSNAASTEGPQQRVYFLTDLQWQKLTEGIAKPADPPEATDPFSPVPPRPLRSNVATIPTDLAAAALRIRTHLIEAGIPLSASHEDDEIVRLKDERTLIVTSPTESQEQIAKYLSTLAADLMIRIDMKVVQLPMTWPPESLGLVFDKGGNLKQTTLAQKETEELLSHLKAIPGSSLQGMPSSTFRSGQRSCIEMVREFIYPTEFDPPELSQVTAKPETDDEAPGAFPVTPTTPTAFEMRPIGVRAEFEAKQLSPGTIQLDIAPEITVFEGFVNYGSPIRTTGRNIVGTPVTINLTDNKIDQPIFHTAKFTGSMVIKSGESVIIGGLASPNHAIWLDKKMPSDTAPSAPGVTMDKDLATRLNSTPEKMVFFIITADTVKR